MRSPEPLADHLRRGQGPGVVHPGRAEQADRAEVLAVDRRPAPPRRRTTPAARSRARCRWPPTARGRGRRAAASPRPAAARGWPSTERTVSTASNDAAMRAGPPTKTWSASIGALERVEGRRAPPRPGGRPPASRSAATGPGLARACCPTRCGGEQRRRPRASASSEVSAASSMVRFSTAPSESTTTSSACGGERPTSCTERMVAVSWRGPDHHRGVVGQLGEQAGRPLEHRLHLAVDLGEELAHLLALAGAEHARRGRGGRRRSGSPCRSGSARRWCGAGPGSPRARAPPSRCGPWPRTPPPRGCATCEEPTGWAVSMYSVTTASRMAAWRALQGALVAGGVGGRDGVGVAVSWACLALESTECQGSRPRAAHRAWHATAPSGQARRSVVAGAGPR